MSVSGQRGPGDTSLGMGVRLTLWAGCACRFPLRLHRAHPDLDCEGGIVQLGQQSEWGGTPAKGLVSVSMSSCTWGCPWPQESLQVRGTTWEALGAGLCRPTGRLVNVGDARPSWLPSWAHLALLFAVPRVSGLPPSAAAAGRGAQEPQILVLAGTLGTQCSQAWVRGQPAATFSLCPHVDWSLQVPTGLSLTHRSRSRRGLEGYLWSRCSGEKVGAGLTPVPVLRGFGQVAVSEPSLRPPGSSTRPAPGGRQKAPFMFMKKTAPILWQRESTLIPSVCPSLLQGIRGGQGEHPCVTGEEAEAQRVIQLTAGGRTFSQGYSDSTARVLWPLGHQVQKQVLKTVPSWAAAPRCRLLGGRVQLRLGCVGESQPDPGCWEGTIDR